MVFLGMNALPVKDESGMILDTMKDEQERRKRNRMREKSGNRGRGGKE